MPGLYRDSTFYRQSPLPLTPWLVHLATLSIESLLPLSSVIPHRLRVRQVGHLPVPQLCVDEDAKLPLEATSTSLRRTSISFTYLPVYLPPSHLLARSFYSHFTSLSTDMYGNTDSDTDPILSPISDPSSMPLSQPDPHLVHPLIPPANSHMANGRQGYRTWNLNGG